MNRRAVASALFSENPHWDRLQIMRKTVLQRAVMGLFSVVFVYGDVKADGEKAVGQTQASPLDYAKSYYSNWVGVPAPSLPRTVRDRLSGPPVSMADYRGRRLLLCSFDAGDFVNAAKEGPLVSQLLAIDKTLHAGDGTNIAVIGFTYGAIFFFPDRFHLSQQIRDLTSFPIVNLTNVGRDLPQPYRILCMPSGIAIDKNGIIVAVYLEPLTETILSKAIQEPDWSAPPRPVPLSKPPDMAKIIPHEMRTWTLYVFRQSLPAASIFRREYARRGIVYDETAIPSDSIDKLNEIEGKVLHVPVAEGDPIRRSQFIAPNLPPP